MLLLHSQLVHSCSYVHSMLITNYQMLENLLIMLEDVVTEKAKMFTSVNIKTHISICKTIIELILLVLFKLS
jgi:hypothetical protein